MRVFLAVVTAGLIAGCVVQPSHLLLPGGQRISQPGVSFIPPAGRSWSVLTRSTYQITMGGMGSARNETYIVQASVFQLPSSASREKFLELVKTGRAAEPQTGRFEMVRNREELDGLREETCVKHEAASKDFGAKRGGDFTLFETYGMNCIHPRNPQVGVFVELSRKAPPDTADPEFASLGDRLLKSVQFHEFR